jgi:hypothetical protein
MKERFTLIKSLGVVSDSWLVNNRGDQIHTQFSGHLNRKMVADLTTRLLQLLALQAGHLGADCDYLMLQCDEHTIYGFDLGSLVLIAISQNQVEAERVLAELRPIADDFRNDLRFMSRYDKRGIERRELISDAHLDDKARKLMGELKRIAV